MSKDGVSKDDEIANLRTQISEIAIALSFEPPYQASLVKRIEALIASRDSLRTERDTLRTENAKLIAENQRLSAGVQKLSQPWPYS